MKDEGIKQDVFRLNSMVSGNVNALQTQANMTISMQEQMLNMATSLNDLQGTVENTTHAFALGLQHLTEMSSYNSSLLQRGFFGLEKHFIETKLVGINTLEVRFFVESGPSLHGTHGLGTEISSVSSVCKLCNEVLVVIHSNLKQ